MPSKDLTPEEYEDLVESGHSCDETCADGDHSRSWTETLDGDLSTALARFACGPVGTSGYLDPELVSRQLWREAQRSLGVPRGLVNDPAVLQAIGERYNELLGAWLEERRAQDVLVRAQEATDRAVREAERMKERARRRTLPKRDRRSPNRATKVDVDPEAWAVVKRQAVADGRKLAEVIGSLLAADQPALRGHRSARPERRFARLFVDDARWTELRLIAVTQGVTVARLVGLTVEREAKRLGWTPAVER